jgi:hypothetical protein
MLVNSGPQFVEIHKESFTLNRTIREGPLILSIPLPTP